MKKNLFTNQLRLLAVVFRLGFLLVMGILILLLPGDLVSGAPSSLKAIDQLESHTAASDIGWSALPNRGLNFRVRAIVLAGDSLYMGGRFTQTHDGSVTDLGRVTRYDIVDGTWHALPNQGLNEEVIALALLDGDLYAGGWFTQTVDAAVTNLGNIARYDPVAETWNALSSQGLDGHIFGLGVVGTDLYVGGLFSQSGDGSIPNLNGVARYDSLSGIWHALPNQGLNGNIYALTADGNDVYTGGSFSQTGDASLSNLGNIAHYDSASGTWHALSNQGLNGTVNAVWVLGSDVYVGGNFTQTSDGVVTNLNGIARYDSLSGTWHALPNQGLDGSAFVFAVLGDDIYVGGDFEQTADAAVTNLGNIARYDTVSKTWYALPNQGLNNWVYAMVVVDGDLYVGGEFNQVADGIAFGLNRVARFGALDTLLYLPLVIG